LYLLADLIVALFLAPSQPLFVGAYIFANKKTKKRFLWQRRHSGLKAFGLRHGFFFF